MIEQLREAIWKAASEIYREEGQILPGWLGETMIRYIEPVVEAMGADTRRLDWLESHPFTAYRERDPADGEMHDHFTLVDEDRYPRVGIVRPTLRAAIDIAMR